MEPKPVYNVELETRAVNAGGQARTATVTLPVEVLKVVFALQRARNLGQEQVLVRLLTWQIDGDPGD